MSYLALSALKDLVVETYRDKFGTTEWSGLVLTIEGESSPILELCECTQTMAVILAERAGLVPRHTLCQWDFESGESCGASEVNELF